jgi:hypothetical protein
MLERIRGSQASWLFIQDHLLGWFVFIEDSLGFEGNRGLPEKQSDERG